MDFYCISCKGECRVSDAEAKARPRVKFERVPSSGHHTYAAFLYVGGAEVALIGLVSRELFAIQGRRVARYVRAWVARDENDRELPGRFKTRRAAATFLLGARGTA